MAESVSAIYLVQVMECGIASRLDIVEGSKTIELTLLVPLILPHLYVTNRYGF
jgi:hypothetical protein